MLPTEVMPLEPTANEVKVPTEVSDEAVTPDASVDPVKFAAGTEFAVMEVLHPKPEFVVQVSALDAVEQDPTASAVGDAVPLVALPTTVFAACVEWSANVTRPVAVNAVVTVKLGAVKPLGSVVAHEGIPVPPEIKTLLLAFAISPNVPPLS